MTDHCAPQIALMSTEADAHITFLEKSLLQLNRRQGLGFLVAKTVIDNGKLQRTAKAVAGLVITIGPVMLAWTTTAGSLDVACTVTTQQEDAIKAVVRSFGFGKTCGLNITMSIGPDGQLVIN